VEHKKVPDRINPRTEEMNGEKGSALQKKKRSEGEDDRFEGILESSKSTVPSVRVAPRRAQAGM
jgi:hypothetical protein